MRIITSAHSENQPAQAVKSAGFGLSISTAMVVGTMIGSGIFFLPVSLAEFGSLSFGGWIISASGALALAFVFARLNQWQPGLGGPYYFTREGIGDYPGFLVAWGYWISIWVGNAAVAIACASYLSLLIPALDHPVAIASTALVIVWIFTFINLMGLKEAGRVQLFTTLLKAIPLFLFGLIGLGSIEWQNLSYIPSQESSLGATVLASSALWLWAFLGIEAASIPADNVRDPKRTLPRATFLGVAIVAVIYGLCAMVIFGVIPNSELASSSGPFAGAATKMWGSWAGYGMIAVAVISTLGALNGLILVGGQMPRAAAGDDLFPKWFGKLNRRGAPANGIVLSSALTSVLILTNISKTTVGLFNFSILLSTTTVLVPYIFCSAAAFRLQQGQQENWPLFSRFIFALAFLFSMWALGGSGEEAVYWGFLLMMFSVPVYVAIKGSKEE